MEKPDANGFVNIHWPSQNIPHGGIFHSRTVEPTIEQQQFLKVLLEESKLTIAQRKKSALVLREYEDKAKAERRPQVPLVRPRTSRRRSQSEIRQSGVFDLDLFKPQKRGEDREKLIEKLANQMAYGDTPEQTPPPPAREPKPARKLPSNKEIWHDLVTQIRERADWLAEMEYLGEAGAHREIIKDQIAERMRALNALGVDDQMSTGRTSASGFSTLRSTEMRTTGGRMTEGPSTGGSRSNQSKKSQSKPNKTSSRKQINKEENVAAYNQFSPLQYSPRRRV